MATLQPPPSKRQKRLAEEAAVREAESQQIPEDLGSIKIQFSDQKSGETLGLPVLVPIAQANVKTLEKLVNSIQNHDRDQHVPYKLYLDPDENRQNITPVVSSLYSALRQSNYVSISTENTLKIHVEPQSIYRVKVVNRCSATIAGHSQTVLAAAFSPASSSRFVTADGAGVAKIMDADTGTPIRSLNGHTGWVLAVAWSPDNKQIATGSMDKTVRIWDAAIGKETSILKGHSGYISALAWEPYHLQQPSRPRVASSSRDGSVKIWDVIGGRLDINFTRHTKKVTCLKWGGNGNIYTTSHDQKIMVFSANSGTLVKTLANHAHRVNHIALSTDFALRTSYFELQKKPPDTEESRRQTANNRYREAAKYEGHVSERFVTASDDHTMFLWNASDLIKPVARLLGHQGDIIHVCISPDGIIASSSFDKSLRLWSVRTGAYLRTLRGHVAPVYASAFSPDGRLLASCSEDATVKIWEVSSGKLIEDLAGSKGAVLCVDWSLNGDSKVISGGRDRKVRIWCS